MLSQITPCLWFDGQADEAAKFYTSFFKDGKITRTQYYGEAGKETHGKEPGSILTVEFELNGQNFVAMNGGPQFKFNEAISFQIECEDQEELNHYWQKLSDGGDPAKQQCGWLGDKYGVSWQVVPKVLGGMLSDPDTAKSQRVFTALMGMKKLDIAALKTAYEG
ncbi:3-demethylubiquinone-9 3-methyltransferase [Hyaloscypha finlandica]|jgi:predicted 3-demethylubiquinone-9 3-methyltransferase (glyoxalase superfamily)|nr:3-demethylubiquinone-9 3-methyltransferase [Hyaloscypha finlandica]KAH8755220.1 3-demethylubiquinone-9 3-methyltransferase [Hyaloscypha sp. PMI_1271]